MTALSLASLASQPAVLPQTLNNVVGLMFPSCLPHRERIYPLRFLLPSQPWPCRESLIHPSTKPRCHPTSSPRSRTLGPGALEHRWMLRVCTLPLPLPIPGPSPLAPPGGTPPVLQFNANPPEPLPHIHPVASHSLGGILHLWALCFVWSTYVRVRSSLFSWRHRAYRRHFTIIR